MRVRKACVAPSPRRLSMSFAVVRSFDTATQNCLGADVGTAAMPAIVGFGMGERLLDLTQPGDLKATLPVP